VLVGDARGDTKLGHGSNRTDKTDETTLREVLSVLSVSSWSVFEKFSRRLDALAAPEHGTNGRQFSARNERGQRERNGTECRRFRGDESQFRVENDVYTERVGG
jgi:hypothetical protein